MATFLDEGRFEVPNESASDKFDITKLVDLWTQTALDFRKRSCFIHEVERGSHLKPRSIPKFRRDAILELCDLVKKTLADCRVPVILSVDAEHLTDGASEVSAEETDIEELDLVEPRNVIAQFKGKLEDTMVLKKLLVIAMERGRACYEDDRGFVQSI